MKIIAFSGVDGSGKTTQRELLQTYLESQGKHVFYFHATEFSLANRLARKLKGSKDNFIPGSEPAVTDASFSSVLVRLVFLTLDGIRFEFLRRRLEKEGVDVMVSDRFFQDSLINIVYLSHNPIILSLVKLLADSLPEPHITFALMVSIEDLLQRERIAEQGENYLKEKIELLSHPPFVWNRVILDGAHSQETLHQTILSALTLS